MIGVMTLDEQWAGTWAADHAAELSATVAIPGLQGRQSSSQVTSPCAEGPGASCSLPRTASCKMREPTGSCCLQVPFSSDIPRWKTSLLIIVGQENWKRLKVSWVHFWPRFLQKQSKRASWSPSRRKSLSSDLFSVLLLIFAGQDHGQLLANVNGVISPPNLLSPMIPPAPQHSIPHITAFREYRPFPPGSLPNRLKIRGGLKVKAFHVQSPERCLHNYYSSCYSANT